jgi:uncharacterized protein YkwD
LSRRSPHPNLEGRQRIGVCAVVHLWGVQVRKHSASLIAALTAVVTLALPFVGGIGPSSADGSAAATTQVEQSASASAEVASAVSNAYAVPAFGVHKIVSIPVIQDSEHLAQKPVPATVTAKKATVVRSSASNTTKTSTSAPRTTTTTKSTTKTTTTTTTRKATVPVTRCLGPIGGSTGGAPGTSYDGGAITGTTSADLASFGSKYNAIRVAHCLPPVPMNHIRYDRCMETRLVWMAEDPSTDPMSAWGHMGSQRSDGVPSRGCDGNLAGGSGNTGATVAQKWWDSLSHRLSLYKPSYTGSMSGVCIYFAMTHGGIPNESQGFTRAAARWGGC